MVGVFVGLVLSFLADEFLAEGFGAGLNTGVTVLAFARGVDPT